MNKEKEQIHAPCGTPETRQLREKRSRPSVEDEGKSKFIFQEPCSNVSMCLCSDNRERKTRGTKVLSKITSKSPEIIICITPQEMKRPIEPKLPWKPTECKTKYSNGNFRSKETPKILILNAFIHFKYQHCLLQRQYCLLQRQYCSA